MDRIDELWGKTPGSCIAAAVVLAAIWLVVFYRGKRTPRTRVVLLASSATGMMILLVLLLVQPLERWGWALALLPAVMVVQHALFLRMVRMPFRTHMEASSPGAEPKDCKNPWEVMGVELKPIFAAARRNSNRYFSPSTLADVAGIVRSGDGERRQAWPRGGCARGPTSTSVFTPTCHPDDGGIVRGQARVVDAIGRRLRVASIAQCLRDPPRRRSDLAQLNARRAVDARHGGCKGPHHVPRRSRPRDLDRR